MQSQQIYQFFAVSSITNAQEKKSKLDPVPILVNYFSGNPAGFFFFFFPPGNNCSLKQRKDPRIHMELISISIPFYSAHIREMQVVKNKQTTTKTKSSSPKQNKASKRRKKAEKYHVRLIQWRLPLTAEGWCHSLLPGPYSTSNKEMS